MIMAHTTGLIHKIQKRKDNDKITRLPKVAQMIIGAVVVKETIRHLDMLW